MIITGRKLNSDMEELMIKEDAKTVEDNLLTKRIVNATKSVEPHLQKSGLGWGSASLKSNTFVCA